MVIYIYIYIMHLLILYVNLELVNEILYVEWKREKKKTVTSRKYLVVMNRDNSRYRLLVG